MSNAKGLTQNACVAALLGIGLMAGPTTSSAQQTIAPASATPGPGPLPEVLAKYASVTAERLRKPEDQNWLLFRRTYDGWGYSPLAQITPANVGRLQLVWSFATGQVEGHQAAHRQQRRDVRGDARQPADRRRSQDRQRAVALQAG